MIVRSCVNGIAGADEQGQIIKTLYCTRDGRFFTRESDGWHKQEPCYAPSNKTGVNTRTGLPKKGSCYPKMRHFGGKTCHQLIAYAWISPRPQGMECDHLNGDKFDWTADNLRWVTPAQNRAWAKRQRALQKLGLTLKWIYPLHLRTLTELSQEQFDRFLVVLPEIMSKDPRPMSYTTLMADIHNALKQMGVY